MDGRRLSRRELIASGAAAGVALGVAGRARAAGRFPHRTRLDFASLHSGRGWPGWTCVGVANLRRESGQGLLEAGSDVFPYDPRPVAFAVDRRFRDAEIEAVVDSAGAGTGLVLRRRGPRAYYAAVYDDEQKALILLRRSTHGVAELARASVAVTSSPLRLSFQATGGHPTSLAATLETASDSVEVAARDAARALQGAGDPGVLATAKTLFPSEGPPVLPALGNLHLLPYGVQEGEVVIASPVGRQLLGEIRERSTAAFAEISIASSARPRHTPASIVAATSGAPRGRGAMLRLASDLPAVVEFEVALDPSFRDSRRLEQRRTNSFHGAFGRAAGLPPGRRVWWRARLRRRGRTTVGPVRSFRTPTRGSGATTVAVAACASQFGPIFDRLAAAEPDVFVWQGDLNYPDTVGPLAQTGTGYAGIWRDFLANPKLSEMLEHTLFAVQRDDHDYGRQDTNSTDLVPWGIHPWEALMESRRYYRFRAGPAEFWVLDERRHKSDPSLPDTRKKTLLGSRQRSWLLRTLATSKAPFKVICSPCTLAPLSANARDGSWATGFTAERDLVLEHIRHRVGGRTLFITGDTHWTMVYDRDGLFEARPCPLGIPVPNDITISDPNAASDARSTPGVAYADDQHGHFALVKVETARGAHRLDLSLVRDDGAIAYRNRFV